MLFPETQNGIGLIASDRGKPEWQIRNVDVCRNQITMNKGATGICWYKCPPPWKGAEFRENKYELSGDAYFAWENKKLTLRRVAPRETTERCSR